MSLATAYAHLITKIEATSPSDQRLFKDKFKHVPEGKDGQALSSRCFWFETSIDGESRLLLPYTPDLSGSPRILAASTLTVHFRDVPARRSVLDEVIEADARALIRTLAKDSNWSPRSTTTIDYLDGFSWRRERDGEFWKLRLRFGLAHT
jgi:hypothetical protein